MTNSFKNKRFEKIRNETSRLLKELGYITTNIAYEKMVENPYLEGLYENCARDSCNRHINRHDKLHAMTVTLNAINMFVILKDERGLRRYIDPITGNRSFGFSTLTTLLKLYNVADSTAQDFTCTCIMLSTFCHDMFRFMTRDHPVAAALLIPKFAQEILPSLLSPEMTIIGYERFLPTIQSSIYKHEGIEEALNAEEGLVMLADVIDNDENRIKNASPIDVVLEDPRPIEHFSCKSIYHPVKISKGTLKKIDLTVQLKESAGWYQVHRMVNALKNSLLYPYISLNVILPRKNNPIEIPITVKTR